MIDQYEIVQMGVDDLLPDPRNPMEHDDAEMQRLVGSVSEHGFLQPVVWNKRTGHIVGGHARVEAARATGLETVPAVVVDFDHTKEAAVNIALNGAYGHFDDAKLTDLLKELDEAGYDLDATGLEPFRIEELLGDGSGGLPGADPDDVPAPPDEPITKRGDVILLGKHRLMCGDSTVAADVERLMGGDTAEMMFTDPPYGVEYEGGHFHSGDVHIQRKREAVIGDEDASIYGRFLPVILAHVDGPCYVWFASTLGEPVYRSLSENRSVISALIIWHKTNATYAAMGAQYKQRHECCLYFKPGGATLRWCGPSDERTVWEIDRDAANTYHPTQKPVALAQRAMGNHTAQTIADFFAGSGSTLIAAEQMGRTAYLMEIDPVYCDVIVARWQQFTGKAAERPSLSLASFES